MLYLESIKMDSVISELHYKGIISWSFSYNPFVKFHGKNFGSCNMTMLYPNPHYDEV